MGFELLEMNDDLYGLLNEVIRERDELIERLESCRMELDDMTEHAEEFKAEVRRMKEERDEARKAARFFRRKCHTHGPQRISYQGAANAWNSRADEPKRIDGKPAGMSAEQFDACYEEDGDEDAD